MNNASTGISQTELFIFDTFNYSVFISFVFNFSQTTVSNLALSEYENLHEKFEVEQSCRTKAEEFATDVRTVSYP